jgi:VCBS repeat protein
MSHCCAFAPSRSKVAALAFALLVMSSLGFAQDSFMLGFSASGPGAMVINRGDFNNDGILDVITGNNGVGVSVNLGKGDGRFRSPLNAGTASTFDMAVGDFNGDGKLDVAIAGYLNSTQGVVQILLGKGDGTFIIGQTIKLALIPFSITAADFNNDGKVDLAVGSDKVYLYKGAGNGTFQSAGSITVGTLGSIRQVRTGDFNADGKADLSVSDGLNLFALWNAGNFVFKTVLLKSTQWGINATPVDVNQDHFTDLLDTYYTCEVGKDVPSSNCTNWEVLLGGKTQSLRQSVTRNLSSGYQGLWGSTAADINGDGINDIVGISNFYQLLIWLGNPDGSYQNTPLTFQIGSNTSASDLVAGDFNCDGKVDFMITAPGYPNSVGLVRFLNATPRATCTPNTISPSVTVCQPQDLAYSNSPIQWIADSRDTSHSVNAMQIYVDNKLVVNSPSSSLNEFLTLSKGPHYVVTKAWDSSGANFQSDRHITIYSGTKGEVCPAAVSSMDICLPTQNQTTSTSLHVFANAYSMASITAMQVYIDHKLIYNDTSGATYVDTAFTVSTGAHYVVVKAFDANGEIYSEARNIAAQ